MRTWSISAAMSTQGMQKVGLLYALDPALVEIHPHRKDLQQARMRYLGHVRTHTLMAPLLVGFCIALEKEVANHKICANGLEKLIATTATTLSAIGDSFFSASVLVFWALLCGLGIIHGFISFILIVTAVLLLCATFFRIYTFFLGSNHGLSVLQSLRTMNLINLAEKVKILNAILIIFFYAKISQDDIQPFFGGNIVWIYLYLLVAALLINRMHISRILLIILGFTILFFPI